MRPRLLAVDHKEKLARLQNIIFGFNEATAVSRGSQGRAPSVLQGLKRFNEATAVSRGSPGDRYRPADIGNQLQ